MLTRSLLLVLLQLVVLGHPAAAKSPGIVLTIEESNLGPWLFQWTYGSYPVSVAPDQELNFSWSAEFDIDDGATILGFRYGWEVTDFNDPDDPGWVTPGWEEVFSAPTQSFSAGSHNLTVIVKDDMGRVTDGVINISVDANVSTHTRSLGWVKGGWSPSY
jgi:hypothetical protein